MGGRGVGTNQRNIKIKMQISIQEVLQKRIEAAEKGTLPQQLVLDRKEYNKKYADAIVFFKDRINKDRKKANQSELPFIAIRAKLAAVRNIEDMRWFYFQCLRYAGKKKGNTFSKCFFGSLKLK